MSPIRRSIIIIIIVKNEKIRVTLCENAAGALYIVSISRRRNVNDNRRRIRQTSTQRRTVDVWQHANVETIPIKQQRKLPKIAVD